MQEEAYLSALSQLTIPRDVIATKNHKTGVWHAGSDRNVSHDYWQLPRVNPVPSAFARPEISFSVPVAPGLLLSDPSMRLDALTKRIMCVRALSHGIHHQPSSPGNVPRMADRLDWFIRWKHSLSITTSQIDKLYFDDFDHRIAGGLLHLVPILARLDDLMESSQTEDMGLPIRRRQGVKNILWGTLAKQLGVTQTSISKKDFRTAVFERLATSPNGRDILVQIGKSKRSESAQNYDIWLSTWSDLLVLSRDGHLVHDPLLYDPFLEVSQSDRVKGYIKSGKGKEKKRTPTLTPEFLLMVLDKATAWVFQYGDWIIDAMHKMLALESVAPVDQGEPCPTSLARHWRTSH